MSEIHTNERRHRYRQNVKGHFEDYPFVEMGQAIPSQI